MSTRFYFEFTGSSPVFKTHLSPRWNFLTQWQPGRMRPFKGPSGFENQFGTGQTLSWAAGQFALDRQYWSPPLSGNQVINGTINAAQLMTREFATTDNVDRVFTYICLCNATGGVRQEVLKFGNFGPAAEFVNNATCRNKRIFTTGTSSYGAATLIANNGDYLVIEMGYSDAAGTTPQAAAKWGINSANSDLNIEEAGTTDANGFIEFSQNFVFLESIIIPGDD